MEPEIRCRRDRLEAIEYARKAVDVAEEMQATDILLMDISKVSSFADFFVILTAESRRQMEAVSANVEATLRGAGSFFHHREGTPDSGWLLLDFGEVIVHLFAPEERELYQLERLWAHGQQVVRIQ